MKQMITLLLMVTIQITFMQKVIASVPLIESEQQVMMHCKMEMMNATFCDSIMLHSDSVMQNCQSDCDMMSVVSVTHFINNEQIIYFTQSQLSYPSYTIYFPHFQPQSLYRPPLFS